MSNNAIYCGFCQGQCPLGVEKTTECRVIQGYECPYFCDPNERELIASQQLIIVELMILF